MNKMFPFTIMGVVGGAATAYAFSKPSKSWSKPVAIAGVAMLAFAAGYFVYAYSKQSENVVQKTLSL